MTKPALSLIKGATRRLRGALPRCYFRVKRSEPARSRTENQQIKSLLLCQLSYGPTRGWVELTLSSAFAEHSLRSPLRRDILRTRSWLAQP